MKTLAFLRSLRFFQRCTCGRLLLVGVRRYIGTAYHNDEDNYLVQHKRCYLEAREHVESWWSAYYSG